MRAGAPRACDTVLHAYGARPPTAAAASRGYVAEFPAKTRLARDLRSAPRSRWPSSHKGGTMTSRNTKRTVVIAVLIAGLVAGLATPAAAADITALVAASQFSSGLFIALVSATGPSTLVDAQLVVNNTTPIVPASVESYLL